MRMTMGIHRPNKRGTYRFINKKINRIYDNNKEICVDAIIAVFQYLWGYDNITHNGTSVMGTQ